MLEKIVCYVYLYPITYTLTPRRAQYDSFFEDFHMPIQTINPTTGNLIQSYEEIPFDQVLQILKEMNSAQREWQETDFAHRKAKMWQVIELLEKNEEHYASFITIEMGKPIAQARAEIQKCAWLCKHYAKNAEEYLKAKFIQADKSKSYVTYQPLGIIYAIMPWNFPFWQVFRFAIPNLMAGNAGLLSHSHNVTGCALTIEKIFFEANFPAVFRTILGNHDLTKKIIEEKEIKGVTLTGSERAGKSIAAIAGNVLKKVVLELGGSDPYIILQDADCEKAADHIVKSRINNAGQVCIAAKRIIVEKTIHDELQNLILEKLKTYQCGNPLEETTKLGPLARQDLREMVQKQVEESIEKGAKLIYGGKIPEGKGFFYPPTLLIHVKPGMPAFDEEIFGPVIGMISVENEKEAIEIANCSRYGLSGAVFTKDLTKGERIAYALQVGTCYVNGMVSSDPRLPFGGIKASGYGRELGAEGIHEFMNIKTIAVV